MFTQNSSLINLKLYWALLLAFLTVGCTTVSVQVPFAQVEAPLKVTKYALIVRNVEAIEAKYSGLNQRPPSLTADTNAKTTMGSGELQYSPGSQIFLSGGVVTKIDESGYSLRAGVQPEFGNFVLRVSANATWMNGTNSSGDQKETFGAGGYGWRAKGVSQSLFGQASLGYEFSPSVMPFLGYSEGSAKAKIKVDQDVAVDDAGGSFSAEDKFDSKSFGLGLVFRASSTFEVSLTAQRAWISGSSTRFEDSVLTSAGLQF